ncbi:MAG TPA: right-handed parallel beta-helix repeat-containing protein [Gaiellaceae bacterium]|nr:right-handed parallel beta-helix repeat-containing protein [Gaiellaceae bacterium]
MKPIFAIAATLVLSAVVGAAQPAAGSPSANVSCGQTLTASTTLQNDLVDCPGNGLLVGADNITIDLNGHTIDGANVRKAGTGAIVTKGRHANVTISNGTITDFYFSGVSLRGRGNVVRKVTVRKIGAGCRQGDICAAINLMNCRGCTIADSVVSNAVRALQVNGINVFGSPGTRVERTRVQGTPGEGLAMHHSPGSRIVGNEFERNRGNGIQVNSSSDATWVTGNDALGNRRAGIAVGASRKARVLGNNVSGNAEVGLLLFDLRESLARGNRARGNGTGIVLYAGQAGIAQFGGKHGASRNRLVANIATKNDRVGIRVRGDGGKDRADNNLLSRNVANSNGRDGGIVVEGSATGNKLRGNTANANAGHGITAVRRTIDAGGNRARRNRRPPQCVGVRCAR